MNLDEEITKRSDFDATLPPEWPEDPFPRICSRIREQRKLVILDDDPTGGQTTHDLEVLTRWNPELLQQALSSTAPAFFILTNSRGIPADRAVALDRDIAHQLADAARDTGADFDLLLRGDSTLRGHYPIELDAVRPVFAEKLDWCCDGVILCPFFLEGGRFTADDLHWVAEEDRMIPAAQTEFARDATFGYTRSNLREWVEEKTAGRIPATAVVSISLETIRTAGPQGVCEQLLRVERDRVIVVNAVTYRDIAVFVDGLFGAQQQGRRFLFRTSASFVKIRSGSENRPLLGAEQLSCPGENGGLLLFGSYVQKSTRQLYKALELPGLSGIELIVDAVLDPQRCEVEIARLAQLADRAISSGQDAVVYTSRQLETSRGRAGDLDIGRKVSAALVEVVRRIGSPPRFLIAKGGTTSSDVATDALNVERGMVLGQILPGVPVWQLQEESRFPGIPYVVFPGNVGTDGSVAEAILKFR